MPNLIELWPYLGMLPLLWLFIQLWRKVHAFRQRYRKMVDARDVFLYLVEMGLERVDCEERNGVWGLLFHVHDDEGGKFFYWYVSRDNTDTERENILSALELFTWVELTGGAQLLAQQRPDLFTFTHSEDPSTPWWRLERA